MDLPLAAIMADPLVARNVFAPDDLRDLAEHYEVDPQHWTTDLAAVPDETLARLEVVVSGWGAPLIDADALARMPRLRAVCHAAGSVKPVVTRDVLARGVVVTSAAAANALPVAEYTVAAILMAAKMIPQAAARYRADPTWWPLGSDDHGPLRDAGTYRTPVGIIGASLIGRRVLALLAPFDLDVMLYDPFVTDDEAAALGARPATLPQMFTTARVVSLHAPDLPSTRGMIDRSLLESLRPGATFINTARPRVVDGAALVDVLTRGDVYALLDVTDPEPLPADHPLRGLPNVVLTPHWAGSAGNEQRRLGRAAIDEALRLARGEAVRHPVSWERWDLTA